MTRLLLAMIVLGMGRGACLAESTIGCMLFVPPTGSIDLGEKGELELPVVQSIVVGFADPVGPAYKAGIRDMDIITHIEGQAIENEQMAVKIIRNLEQGKRANFKYQRPVVARNRVIWHRRTARVEPMDRLAFLKGTIVAYEHPPTGALHHTHYSERAVKNRVTQVTAGLIENDARTTPFLGATHVAEESLFPRRLTFVTQNERIEVEPPQWHSEFSADVIWEWSITSAPDKSDALKALEAVARGEVSEVVFTGSTYYHTHPVSPYEAYKARVLLDYWRMVQLPKEQKGAP
jgi:hypothetical protein